VKRSSLTPATRPGGCSEPRWLHLPTHRNLRHTPGRSNAGQQIADKPQTVLVLHGEDRFGVELHALDRQAAVPHAHGHVFPGRRHLQHLRDALPDQRMVAPHRQRRGQILVDALAAVCDEALLAVIWSGQDPQCAPEVFDERLMPEADPEQRVGLVKMVDVGQQVAGLGRYQRPEQLIRTSLLGQEHRFYFLNECRDVGLRKMHGRCRDTMMFHIRRNVFMMWMATLE
jgi:hypothetical protein